MMYQSPIRLYEHLSISENLISDELQLSKIKKLINAEFAIAEHGIISIDNFNYNKSDIINEIDAENFKEKFIVHQQIWNNTSLLSFMEKAEYKVALIKYDEWGSFLNQSIFQEFFASNFATAFNKCSSEYTYEYNFYMLGELMKAGKYIPDEYFDEAFQNMRIFLDTGTKLFKNTNKENCTTNPDFERWVYNDFGKFISKLPYAFYENINSFTVAAINLSVELQKVKRNYSSRISHQLTYLLDIVHPDYAELIKSNHEVFTSNPKSKSGWTSYRLILIGIVILGRFGSSFFSSNSTPDIDFNSLHPVTITVDSSANNTIKIDSSIKRKLQEINQRNDSIPKIDTTTFKNY